MLVSFALSVRERLADVKKLSIVTFLPVFKYGDMRRITKLSGSDSLAECSSSFPKYGKALHRYSKTCLKRNLKGPEQFSAKARFPFNQGTLHTV